ncbi:hypothetical protein H0H93_003429 [Arthromyces matolae]|nr:hypothetical protein H0H93_003429 [Arthromyces matolae]
MKFHALFQIVAASLLSINLVVNAIPVPATGNSDVPSTGDSVSSSPSLVPLSTRDLYPDIDLEARGGGSNERSSPPPQPNQASHTDDKDLMERFEKELKIIMDKPDAERATLHKTLVDTNRDVSQVIAMFSKMDATLQARALVQIRLIDNDMEILMDTARQIPGFKDDNEGSGHGTS